MLHEFSRTQLLIGQEALAKLSARHVAVFGIGGVGSFAVEALARCGIGRLTLIDHDTVEISNLNRQIHATHKTLGQPKVEVMKQRILDINPQVQVNAYRHFYLPAQAGDLLAADYDYIIDAVDTVTAKIDLIVQAQQRGIPIISCMGTGNKLDPGCLQIDDIYNTSVCPLAKVMRRELRRRGITALKVVYSREEPSKFKAEKESGTENKGEADSENGVSSGRGNPPGSIVFVPASAGLLLASQVIRDLIN